MVKIFPTRFILKNINDIELLWKWVNEKIQDTKITQIVPSEMEHNKVKDLIEVRGLLETHCTENITTSEFAKILQPYPDFVKHIYLTFQ